MSQNNCFLNLSSVRVAVKGGHANSWCRVGQLVFILLLFNQDSCVSKIILKAAIAGGRTTREFLTPRSGCPCHSKSPGLEELLLSLASFDNTQPQHTGKCAFCR